VAFFQQTADDDTSVLVKLCSCLRVRFGNDGHRSVRSLHSQLWDLGVRGVHKGILRVRMYRNTVLLAGTRSPLASPFLPAAPFTPLTLPGERRRGEAI
jgi:hypothetical protein